MTATLTFNLPEEQEEFQDAVNGNAFKAVIWQIDQYMRSEVKHGNYSEEVTDIITEIREELRSIMNEHNVSYE
jgi:hypothetical protein